MEKIGFTAPAPMVGIPREEALALGYTFPDVVGDRQRAREKNGPPGPKFNEISEFYDESHLGWETDHAELTKLAQKTRNDNVEKVAKYIDQNSATIEAFSPKGEPGTLTNGDLKLYRNLSKVDAAIATAPFVDGYFDALDYNRNGKIGKHEVKKFLERNDEPAADYWAYQVLDGFEILATASGKAGGSIDQRDVVASNSLAGIDKMMHKEYKDTEFARRSAPIALTVGGAFAALAAIGETDDQREKQRNIQGAFRFGAAVGKLLSYPFLNKSIDNYYNSTARQSISKLFG